VRKPNATLLDFGDALSATAIALERFLGSLRAPASRDAADATALSLLFEPLQKVDPLHWQTRFLNQLARCRSGALELACRACAMLAQLADEFGLLWFLRKRVGGMEL